MQRAPAKQRAAQPEESARRFPEVSTAQQEQPERA
jgi:hypothetical protein